MFKKLDEILFSMMKNKFRRSRKKFIKLALDKFHQDNTDIASLGFSEGLKHKVEVEVTRIYAIIDESILRALIARSGKNFWINTCLLSLFGLYGVYVVKSSPLAIIAAPVGALVNWVSNLVTISDSYHGRVIGGINSVLCPYSDHLLTLEKIADLKKLTLAKTKQSTPTRVIHESLKRPHIKSSPGMITSEEKILMDLENPSALENKVTPSSINSGSSLEIHAAPNPPPLPGCYRF